MAGFFCFGDGKEGNDTGNLLRLFEEERGL
jgi:hypothetical protein